MSKASDYASQVGYSIAFFNSSWELKQLLDRAVKSNWAPDEFIARLRNTNWFRKHSESFRKMEALRTADPSTYKQQVAASRMHLSTMAGQLGATLSDTQLNRMAVMVLQMGWTDEQIKRSLSGYIKTGGAYKGGAASVREQIRQMASEYGITMSEYGVGSWVVRISKGTDSIEGLQGELIKQAISKYPSLKRQLMDGETIASIVEPYKQAYAEILEVSPDQVTFRDSHIQQALSSKDSKGQPATKSLWQFEQDLRNDKRWLKTKNAQDSMMGQTHNVLKMMGLVV